MADFDKIAQVALPALAGAAAAFDPYRQVSRGLNQAVIMRSRLKGQADREAHRESMEERAIADQEMQRQRQDWAETQFGWAQERQEKATQSAAEFDLVRKDKAAGAPEQFTQEYKAARTPADIARIDAKVENLQRGTQFVSMFDEAGIPLTDAQRVFYSNNPGYASAEWSAISAGKRNAERQRVKAIADYRSAYNQLKEMYDNDAIDIIEFEERRNALYANAPGEIGIDEAGPIATPEERQAAVNKRLRESPQYAEEVERAEYLYDNVTSRAAENVFSKWAIVEEGVKSGQIPLESAKIARTEMQEELDVSNQAYLKAASNLISLGYEPKPPYTLPLVDELNPNVVPDQPGGAPMGNLGLGGAWATAGGSAAPQPQVDAKGIPTGSVEVAGGGLRPGMSPAEVVSSVERKFVEGLVEKPTDDR